MYVDYILDYIEYIHMIRIQSMPSPPSESSPERSLATESIGVKSSSDLSLLESVMSSKVGRRDTTGCLGKSFGRLFCLLLSQFFFQAMGCDAVL